MKLTTKLIICFGLSFICGMQAFADNVGPVLARSPFDHTYIQIQNIDCSSNFIIHGTPKSGWEKRNVKVTVPSGKTSPIISADEFKVDLDDWLSVCAKNITWGSCKNIFAPSWEGRPYPLKFHKVNGICVPK